MHYYPKYPGDYLRDTAHLTLAEHGAYSLLLDYYYSREQPFPRERRQIYRILRAETPAEREAVDTVLDEFWFETADGWENHKANEVIEDVGSRREKRRKAAQTRWANAKAADASAMHMHVQTESIQNQSQSQSQKPETERARDVDPFAASFDPSLKQFEEDLKKIYPWRAKQSSGKQGWRHAMHQVHARLQEQFTREDIVAAVGRYQAYCAATGKLNTDFVMSAQRFMQDPENLQIPWETPAEPPRRHQTAGDRQLNSLATAREYLQEDEDRREAING